MSDLRRLVAELRLIERRSASDVAARKLGRKVLAWVRSVRDEFAETGSAKTLSQWPLSDPKLPYKVSYIQLQLKYDPKIAKHLPPREPWVHLGAAGRNKQGTAFRLIYRIAVPTIENWMLEPLSADITGVIRHEMEHGIQFTRGEATGVVKKTDSTGERDWGDIPATREYLLHPHELEAVATQMHLMAKRTKKPVSDFIESKVRRLIKALKRRDVPKSDIDALANDYRKAVTQYVAKRYPEARFKTRSGEIYPASQHRISRGRTLRSKWW